MTTIGTNVGVATPTVGSGSSFLNSVADWVTSSDHKKVGRLFTGSSMLFAVGSLVTGALLGLERMRPSGLQIVPGDAVIQLLSIHRFGLVLASLAPLFMGLAVAVVPMQVGARSLALPRLAQSGFWMWLFGVLTVVVSIIGNGGPGGGTADLVDLYLLGLGLTMAGVMAAGLSVVVTILTARAPGMSLDRVPPFTWSALVGSFSMLLTLPVAIGTIVYLYVDHTYGQQAFGGNKGIDGFLAWVMSQPQTFVFIVMALGVLAEIAPVAAKRRQPMRSLVLVGVGLLSTSVLGAVTQSTHVLEWSGSAGDKFSSLVPFLFFNGLPLVGALVLIAAAALSLKEGQPSITPPMLLASSGAILVLAGVAGHFFFAIESSDLGGTAFEEGVLLYLVLGGALSGLGALAHWSPKLSGRMLPSGRVSSLAGVGLLGAILGALPLYVAGLSGQPGGAVYDFDYSGPIALWNFLSALGLIIVAIVIVAFAGMALATPVTGGGRTDDPWDGQTLEWAIPSPAPSNNFAELVMVSSSEPLLDAKPATQEVPS